MASFVEERQEWVERELQRIIEERPDMTHYQRRVMRGYLEKEFADVWEGRDYVYGLDEGGAPRGHLGRREA